MRRKRPHHTWITHGSPCWKLRAELHFPKDKDAKPRIIRYVFVALKFRHSNMEILLKVMQKLVSYGRLSVARYSLSRGQSVQPLLRILLIRESQKFSPGNHEILARSA